ncbi:restriction endonuclease subunit S [Bacillus mycoides]|uniref:restriction endonuclease subunit S n=1 Tax=Bacillus mycoides TaxID=1405 RepID=UPI003CFE79DD
MKIYTIGELCDVIKGNVPIMKAVEGEYPLVTTAEERKTHNKWQFDCKAVCIPLVSSTGHGHASIKRIHYQEGKFSLGNILAAILPKDRTILDAEYLYIYLSLMKDEILVPLMKGTANVSLTVNSLKSVSILVPGLQEQTRVVKNIKKISKYSKSLSECISNQEANVIRLRQSILQQAVQGKLVPQNPKDEPASILLEKTKQEKERFIKEKSIKKDKPMPQITDEEKLFVLPKGWEWTRLGDITNFLSGCAFKSSTYVDSSNNQIIRLGNVKNNSLLLESNCVFISDELALENQKYKLELDDILVTMTGTRGKRDYFYTLLIGKKHLENRNLFLNQRVGCLKVNSRILPSLVNLFLKADLLLNEIFKTETGTANQGNIGVNAIRNLIFPLPPLSEQKRIVEKVEQLMILCDELEANIEKSKHESEQLMKAVLQGAFTVKEEVLN